MNEKSKGEGIYLLSEETRQAPYRNIRLQSLRDLCSRMGKMHDCLDNRKMMRGKGGKTKRELDV